MFESRISAGGVEKLPFPRNLRISSWSFDMAGHAKKCVERYCELANKTTQQLYKVSPSCINDHHFKEVAMWNPKHSAKYVWRTGTSASSTARAVTSYEMIRQRTRSTSSLFLTSSLFRTITSRKGDHTVTETERKKVIKNITLRINNKRSVRNDNSWAFTIGSFVIHGFERPC